MPVRCEVCKLYLQDQHAYEGHILGKRHIKNVEQSEVVRSIIERSIFVSNLPNHISSDEIIKFFLEFGEMIKYRFGSNFVIIEFKTKDPVEYLLKNQIYYKYWKLNIQPRVIRNNRTDKKKKPEQEIINNTEDLNYVNIKPIFEVESTFEQQLTVFLERISIDPHEISTRYESTCTEINEIFKSCLFPKCKTYRFGSTVSGLGFKNCDLDIYLDTGLKDQNSEGSRNMVNTTTILPEVKRILYARPNLFSNIVPIPRAKTPIIKFTYLPTKISCDISFKNSLAVHNSQLIRFYMMLHPNIRPAMMVLKYWVSNNELKGGDKITKYALTMLLIFYLQQTKLVPLIINLKQSCVPEIVEGWQANFDNRIENYQNNENDQKFKSVPDILLGFFDFYAEYDFKSYVLCPIEGLSIERAVFKEIEHLPESMDRYKEYLRTNENPMPLSISRPMCVQDPNELNHNITGNISEKYIEVFQSYCLAARKICISLAESNYKDLLPNIFSLNIKPMKKASEEIFNVSIFAKNLIEVGLPDDFKSRTDIENKTAFIVENWFNLVLKLIKIYLEDVLKLKVQIVQPEQEQKQQKVNVDSDVHSKNQDQIIMHCIGNYCLWRNRKNKLTILDPSLSLLEKELKISEKIFNDPGFKKNEGSQKLEIDFMCRIIKKYESEPHLFIILSDNDCSKKMFLEIANYLKNKMPQVLIKTLGHMQQFKRNTICDGKIHK